MEAIRDCFLTQHVTKATHKRGDQRANILDLVLTTIIEEGMVDSISHLPLGKTHHCTLIFKVNCYADPKPKARTYRYDKGDYDKLRNIVSQKIENVTCEEAWLYLENVVRKEFA